MRIDDFQKPVEANSMLHISDTDIEIPGSEQPPKIPARLMLQLSPTPQFLFKIDDLPVENYEEFVKAFVEGHTMNIRLATGEEIPARPTPDNASGGTLSLSGKIKGCGFIPVPTKITGRNTADPIQTVEFTLINFPRFIGSHADHLLTLQNGNPSGVVSDLMSVDLKAGSWEVHIVEKPNRKDVFKKLTQEGGYGPTHHGWITRSDDKTFAPKEVQVLVDGLALFLSFARGQYCGINQLLGTDQNDEPVWEQWSVSNVEPWKGARSWFDRHNAQTLEELFPGFWDTYVSWSNDDRGRIALEWYLASNEQKAVHSSIVLTHAALERLAYVHAGPRFTGPQLCRKRPEEEEEWLARALSCAGVPTQIPGPYGHLEQFRAAKKFSDGPHTLVRIRNELIHQQMNYGVLPAEVYVQAKHLGLHYVELMLLKQFGYQGSYRNRVTKQFKTVPWASTNSAP